MDKINKMNNAKQRNDTKKSIKVLLTLGVMVALLVIFFLVSSAITKYTGYSVITEDDEDGNTDIGICLKQHDITLYINTENTKKTLTSIGLEYLDYVKIMNCLENKEFCYEQEVDSFPLWIVDGEKVQGDLNRMLEYIEC